MQIDWTNRIIAVLEYSRPVNQGRYPDHVLYDEYNTEGFSGILRSPFMWGGLSSLSPVNGEARCVRALERIRVQRHKPGGSIYEY